MSVLITADLHLTDNPRDAYRHEFVGQELPKVVREHHPDYLIILGDLTEEKDRHGAWLVNRVVKLLHQLARLVPVIILRGNHDYASDAQPFFHFVRRIENIIWINRPEIIADQRWLALPHTMNYKRDWKELSFNNYRRIFAHNTFAGAITESGRKMDGIPIDLFPNCVDYVISGDVHVPQRLGPVTYVGAPYLVDFGDSYDPRMLLLNGSTLKSIPAKGRQKRLIETTANLPLRAEANPGDIVKVRVLLGNGEYARWREIRDKVRHWADQQELELFQVSPVVDRKALGKKSASKIQRRSDEQVLIEYAEWNRLDNNTTIVGKKFL